MFLLYTARFIFYDYNLKVLGVIRTLIEVQEKIKSHPDLKKRYFLKPDEVILLADGTKIVVNNQWGTLFPRFLEAAKKLYQVTNDTESNTPISRLKITFGNGKVIQETQAAETFRQFVMTVGVEQVQSLNIKVCKIPLISNTLHEKYQRAQKPLGNGRFLMTCSNTKTKKRDIERIAKALGIQVTVEIVQWKTVIQEICLEKYFFMKSTYIALNSKIHPIKKI